MSNHIIEERTIARSVYTAIVTLLGFDANLVQAIRMEPDAVYVTAFALGDDGDKYLRDGRLATVGIVVKIEEDR